jgi:FAD:protein FMN transferase
MKTPPSASVVRDIRFRAMGSDIHVIVVGGAPELPGRARARIDELESRWSRFLAASEISRLNRADGRPVMVSSDTIRAVTAAIDAWRETDGRFDPTVLPALIDAGYDQDFATLEDDRDGPTPHPRFAAAPGCAGIIIDRVVGAITLPPDVAIDLGGIGKGLAADLVVAELRDGGARGACVNAGGDLRVWGEAPGADGWIVDVEHLPEVRIALADGAIATSSSTKRRWTRGDTTYHHLLDPRQGVPAHTGLVAVTVIAGDAATAEALTKAAFVAGVERGTAIVEGAGATGLLVTDTGSVIRLAGIEEFLR